MNNLFQQFRDWLRARLSKKSEAPEIRRPIRRNFPPTINREEDGAFYYLKDILDRIPRCQKMLRRVKRIDPDAYEYHRRVGARLVPDRFMVDGGQLSSMFLSKRPSIGMTYMITRDAENEAKRKDHIPASFHYFEKISRRGKNESGLLPTLNDMYKLVVVHDDGDLISGGLAYFEIMPNGTARIMRKKETMKQSFRTRKRGEKVVTVSHNIMDYPKYIIEMHIDNAQGDDFNDYSAQIFTVCVNNFCTLTSEDELQVRCEKGKIVAMFNVCTKRTPYFFADRETTLAIDGKRKRIFHIVSAHSRVLKDGRTSEVKEHYRGERRFWWGGNKVTITVPKLHHLSLNSFSVAGHEFDEDNVPSGSDWLTSAELGQKISGMMQ